MRQSEVIQPGDVQRRHVEIKRRLAVRSEESSALAGMLIDAERHVEGALDACCRAFEIDDHAVGGGARHGEAVGLREAEDRCVVGFGGTESAGEFLYA